MPRVMVLHARNCPGHCLLINCRYVRAIWGVYTQQISYYYQNISLHIPHVPQIYLKETGSTGNHDKSPWAITYAVINFVLFICQVVLPGVFAACAAAAGLAVGDTT